ncbi:hypothetical protein IFM89_028108, partial [Coptis chinensis]
WGEKYDRHGSSIKYTDKWAERLEGDGWTKWDDKSDENFNQYSQGVKQGETWWEGKYGECSGTVHGGKVIMALVGCTSTGKAVVESIGTLMFSRTHGMRASGGSTTAKVAIKNLTSFRLSRWILFPSGGNGS